MTLQPTICHRDGTVSYWSECAQSYQRRQPYVPALDLAAMPSWERERVRCHLRISRRAEWGTDDAEVIRRVREDLERETSAASMPTWTADEDAWGDWAARLIPDAEVADEVQVVAQEMRRAWLAAAPTGHPSRRVIRDLRYEAGVIGDDEQVALCDRALMGDADALEACGAVIADARAQFEVAEDAR